MKNSDRGVEIVLKQSMKLTEFQRTRLARKRFAKRIARQGRERRDHSRFAELLDKAAARELGDLQEELGGSITYDNILRKHLPETTRYLLEHPESEFAWKRIKSIARWRMDTFKVPEVFSLIDEPSIAYEFLRQVLWALLKSGRQRLLFDYEGCKQLDIGAQVVLDIIIKDVIQLYDRCTRRPKLLKTLGVVKEIGLTNIIKTRQSNEAVLKILYSVGSPAIHTNAHLHFSDLEPYKLNIYKPPEDTFHLDQQQGDAIETTKLVTYVQRCLRRVGKCLVGDEEANLYKTISEILINASEHSSVRTRYSIGYFQDEGDRGAHSGNFRLVILNFGRTIYEKFKDPNCPNKQVVTKMSELSDKYRSRQWFRKSVFEEETLWTLYALQEGVTSTSPDEFEGRGNGSIQFIKSFLELNGSASGAKSRNSRMNIVSGRTLLRFDGTYGVVERETAFGKFRFMMFNHSGDFEDKPDDRFLEHTPYYFPGTIISATIWLDEVRLKDAEK